MPKTDIKMRNEMNKVIKRVMTAVVILLCMSIAEAEDKIIKDGIEYEIVNAEEPYLQVTNVYKEAGTDINFPNSDVHSGV